MKVELPEASLGRKYVLEGLYSLAIEPLQQAREILSYAQQTEGQAAVLHLLLKSFQKQGRYSCVLKTLQDIEDQGILPNAQATRLHALIRLRRWDDALVTINQLLEEPAQTRRSVPATGDESIFLLPSLPVGTRSEQLVVQGQIYTHLGNAERAHSCSQRALLSDSPLASVSKLVGFINLGRFQDAEQLLAADTALSNGGGKGVLRREQGSSLSERGQYPEATKEFESSLELLSDPEQVAWSIFELARMYHRWSRHIFAEGLYTRAFESLTSLNLFTDAHHVSLSYAQLLHTLGQHSKAENLLETAVSQMNRVDTCRT